MNINFLFQLSRGLAYATHTHIHIPWNRVNALFHELDVGVISLPFLEFVAARKICRKSLNILLNLYTHTFTLFGVTKNKV